MSRRHPATAPTAPASRLDELEASVAELRAYRDALSFRLKVVVGVLTAILGIAALDAFLTQVLRGSLQSYLGVMSETQVKDVVWTEMRNQVATSYGATFVLGTLKPAQDPGTPRFVTLPFFGASDLSGVSLCYTIQETGASQQPTGIEVRLDQSGVAHVIRPSPEDAAGLRQQHNCLNDLGGLFGVRTGAVGSQEHVLSFALSNKNAVSDRKDVTVLVNVVGKLPYAVGQR